MTLVGDWKKVGQFATAELYCPEQDEKQPSKITVNAFRFEGTNTEVALVFGGVHALTEPAGVTLAARIRGELEGKARTNVKPTFTTILIDQLIDTTRFIIGPGDGRYVQAQRPCDPNRNFPRPGESYDYTRGRGIVDGKYHRELIDYYDQPFKDEGTADRMIAENRILIQLIELVKPVRAVSIHAHSLKKVRGDAPGIFVDPRGGFSEHSDVSYTAEGDYDDQLAKDMLDSALTKYKSMPPLKDASGKRLSKPEEHPFAGNLVDSANKITDNRTVHYSSAVHPRGASFGMWAPTGDKSARWNRDARKGITTITVEIPQYKNAPKALGDVMNIHFDVLMSKFLKMPGY